MKKLELFEIGMIAATVLMLTLLRDFLPGKIDAGVFIALIILPALLQILMRDLWLMRRRQHTKTQGKEMRCMCLESCAAWFVLLIAVLSIFFGWSKSITPNPWIWIGSVAFAQLLAFLMKDWIVDLKTFRLRRDPDHINLIFKW